MNIYILETTGHKLLYLNKKPSEVYHFILHIDETVKA